MRFGVWSSYRFAATVLGTLATVALAIAMRSAWALVLGQVATQLCLTIGSYVVAPFRPQLAFDKLAWAEIREYGWKAAGTPVLLALAYQAPAILLGRFTGATSLGIFVVNLRLARLPVEVAIQLIGSVAMPAYAKIRTEQERLGRAWSEALTVISIFAVPLGVCLAWLGDDLPTTVYGAQYAGPRGLFALLVTGGVLWALTAASGPLFWGVARPDLDRWTQLSRVLCIFGAGILFVPAFGSIGMALALMCAMGGALALSLWLAARHLALSWATMARHLLPGLLSGAGVLATLILFERIVPSSLVLRALGATFLGVIAVTLAILSQYSNRLRNQQGS